MKLEVGMFIRFDGMLGKIEDNDLPYEDFVEIEESFKDEYDTSLVRKEDIQKASFNIIDLIEVGDFVNGCRVIEIIPKEKAEDNLIRLTTKESAIYGVRINELEIHIKTILTHEQYEANCYKVVE